MQKGGSLRLGCLVAITLIAGVGVRAKPQAPQRGRDITIRTTTRIVEFSVVATDSKGRMIGDLRPEEVELYDGGKPEDFSVYSKRTWKSCPARTNCAWSSTIGHPALWVP